MALDTALVFIEAIVAIVSIIGMFGNLLVCVVIWRTPAMHTLTNAFIFNQATVDFFGSLFTFLSIVIPVPDTLPNSLVGLLYCHVWQSSYLLWCMFTISSFNLAALTFERYLAIVYPFQSQRICHRRGATIVIAFLWVVGFSFGIYAAQLRRFHDGLCLWHFSEITRGFGFIILVLQYIIPVSSMFIAYIHTAIELKRSAKRIARIMGPNASAAGQAHESADESLLRARRNTFKTLVIVFVAFAACWTLSSTLVIVDTLGFPINAPYLATIAFALVESNTAINPIIYALKYKQFQAGLKKLLPCKGRTNNEVNPQTTGTLA